MDNQGKVNPTMIVLGATTILICLCVGMLSAPAYLGILGGIALIWTAFPRKYSGVVDALDVAEADPTSTSTGINLKLD